MGFRDPEKLTRTDQLLQAVLCELKVVVDGHPHLVLGDFNIEPSKIPCLAKGISEGSLVDFSEQFAACRGNLPAPTCKNIWDSVGTRRDFILGNPAAFAACTGCWVDECRWSKPHFSIRTVLDTGRWTSYVTKATTFTPIWPVLWLPALDKSKTSRNKEVQQVWLVYEERLKTVDLHSVMRIEEGLSVGDPSSAWSSWSHAAESALADAYCLAGSPMPIGGILQLGRGRFVSARVQLGGAQVRRTGPYRSDEGEAEDLAGVCLYSLAPVIRLRRRLKVCIDISASIVVHGFTLAKSLELSQQWERILADGPTGPVTQLEFLGMGGLQDYHAWVLSLYNRVVEFVRKVVIHRREHGIRAWRTWVLEHRSSHPYRWLRPDLVPPAPILAVKDRQSGKESFLTDQELRSSWMPIFCRTDRGAACEDSFVREVGRWLPRLPEIVLPPLNGQMLYDAVASKYASAGSLDGWNWRELKALPVCWFDGLGAILGLTEETGVWPEGLLDAYMIMIPKAEGNSTPLGQRPLSVLPVVYRLWVTVRLEHLQEWCDSWLPDSVFSAGKGRSSVDAWYSTSLDIEEAISGIVDDDIHVFVADVVKSFDTVDRNILDCVLSSLGLPGWIRHAYFEYHAKVRIRFKLATGPGDPWTRDGGIPKGAL